MTAIVLAGALPVKALSVAVSMVVCAWAHAGSAWAESLEKPLEAASSEDLSNDAAANLQPPNVADDSAVVGEVLLRLQQATRAARDAALAAEQARALAHYVICARLGQEACAQMQHPARASALLPEPEPEAAGAAEAGAGPEAVAIKYPLFSGLIGANLISVSGNANAISGKLQLKFDVKHESWFAELRGNAAYGQAAVPDDQPQVTAQNADARLYGERRFGTAFFLYSSLGTSTDRVASIAYQLYGEPGVGIVWFEALGDGFVRTRLKTDVGFRFTREERFQYFPTRQDLPDLDIYALRVAVNFVYALSVSTSFEQMIEVLPDLVDRENIRGLSTSRLSAQVMDQLALTLAFNVRYIGSPAEGKKPIDTELAAGLSVTF